LGGLRRCHLVRFARVWMEVSKHKTDQQLQCGAAQVGVLFLVPGPILLGHRVEEILLIMMDRPPTTKKSSICKSGSNQPQGWNDTIQPWRQVVMKLFLGFEKRVEGGEGLWVIITATAGQTRVVPFQRRNRT